MKKFLLYISVLTLMITLYALQPGVSNVFAADETPPEDTAKTPVAEVQEEAKKAKKKTIEQDMYLRIYQSVNSEPEDKTIKTVAKKYGMTESEAHGLVVGGDLTPLAKKSPQLSVDRLQQQYSQIIEFYKEEKEMEDLRSELTAAITPSEIYSDGNTSNSEFDLLYDLGVIEIILFNETSANAFGGTFDSPDLDLFEGELDALVELFDDPDAKEPAEQEGVDPLTCIDDESNLKNALDEFDNENQGGGQEDEEEALDPAEEEFPQAEPDEWPTEFLCPDGGFFCIEVELDVKNAKLYQDNDNCIACHIEKINKALDEMLKKPLSPNKMTGDILDTPKCKSSFTNLPANMKIITVAVPAPQPQNKDVYFKFNIAEEWNKFNERYKPIWYDKTDAAKAKDAEEPTKTIQDQAARKAITDAGPDETIADIQTRTNETVTAKQKETQDEIRKDQEETKNEGKNTQYQLILNELNTMNVYFNAMKETFEKMKKPCDNSANKTECK